MAVATDTHMPALGRHRREEVGRELQATLVELIDLSLIGKQLHWNIFGRPFKPLHERLADVAERIRGRMDRLGEIDLASQDVLIEVVRDVEKQLWMLRASLPAGAR